MKTSIRFVKNIMHTWFKTSLIFLTCILFLIFNSCQKNEVYLSNGEYPYLSGSTLAPELCRTPAEGNISKVYYGHKLFIRGHGAPQLETKNIHNPDFSCYDGIFKLKIKNGRDKKTRVSSAEISIDGILIAGHSDFSKNVDIIIKPITGLTPASVLEVKLYGTPGSYIDLWIEGSYTLVTPSFEIPGLLCQNITPPALPLESTNTPGITGTWNPASINTTIAGKTSYKFTPDKGQCASTVTMEIEVIIPIIPTFTQIGPVLQNSVAPVLATTSANGIPGTWNPPIVNTSSAGTFTFIFTPVASLCASPATMNIEVTSNGTISDIDGNAYKIVKIGDQWWMAENLKTTKYSNGDLIGSTIPTTLDISGEFSPKYQWANNGNESNVDIYARLYTWYAVTDNRGVCPTGWHVPSDAEWTSLTGYLTNNGYGFEGSGSDIAKSLAAKTGWNADVTPGNVGNDQSNNNASGFTALPSGYRYSSGNFIVIGTFTGLWSSTEFNTINAWYRGIYSNNKSLLRSTANKKDAGPIRCIKDN